MKCPVCKNTILNNEMTCQYCGFADLHREFINKQDAQDWEEKVVWSYRDRWLHGVLNAEEWLERIYNYQKLQKESEIYCAHNLSPANLAELSVNSPEQIYSVNIEDYDGELDSELVKRLECFNNLKKLHIFYGYKGMITAEGINAIIHACPNLTELSITHKCDCEMLSKLNLTKIEKLSFSCNKFTPIVINAPVLKKLDIFASDLDDKKKTSKSLVRCYFDFSGMPCLETFSSSCCYYFDYSSLGVLSKLKHIKITDKYLTDLLWLSEKYQLEKLSVFGKVVSLAGVECQKNLKKLQLQYNKIRDVSALVELHQLEYLDLFKNDILDEDFVRQLNISTTLLTKMDRELYEIEDRFVSLYGLSFSGEVYRLMLYWDRRNEKTALSYQKKRIQKWKNTPYPDRVKAAAQTIFSLLYIQLCEGKYCQIQNPTNQHKRTYIESGLKYYPFLKLSDEMKSDIANEQLFL